MPRQARQTSESGIYHVIFRGINQQRIFEDEEDNNKYLQVLMEYKTISGYKLLSYCLMGNHIHLLIKVEKEELYQIFKRIGGKYVYWYNTKYKRIGHLFQDRFKSEPVDDDKYLLTVIKYIHQNPIKAQIVGKINEYQWSSYNEYFGNSDLQVADTDYVLEMINKSDFIEFHNHISDDKCLDITEVQFKLTDEEAKKIISKISKCDNGAQIQELDVKERNKLIKNLRNRGLSIRQISRLTGISKGIVEKYS